MQQHIVRRATTDDQQAIEHLLGKADRLVLYTDRSSVRPALGNRSFYLVEAGGQLVCVCGLFIAPETVAQVRVFGLLSEWAVGEALRAILPVAGEQLGKQDVTTLAFIGIEAWLLEGLAANGFRLVNTIVSLQKTDFNIPDKGCPHVTIRPAARGDFPGILAIDRAVFVPLWHNTEGTLSEYLSVCPYFGVAELDGTVVGYQCLNLIGRHGHVTRIAVHPDYHNAGRGEALLQAIEARAMAAGIRKLVVLTTRTAHWFRERGFVAGDKSDLPGRKKSLYNYQRNSKVFYKLLSD